MSWKTQLLQSTDSFLHIYNRGVDRGTLFFRETDFEFFLRNMAESLSSVDITLLAYALLPNHFHLIARQGTGYAVSSYMQMLCWNYSRYVNRKRQRTGHLFGERFRIKGIQDDASLLRLSHYIHWNPVTAGLARTPSDWKYSSVRGYADNAAASFVAVGPILSLVGSREGYIQFLTDYDPSDPGSVYGFLK